MRTRAVQALATIENDTVTRALNRASGDDIEKVRMAAARSWSQQQGKPARDMLLSLATNDESNSVRAGGDSFALRSLMIPKCVSR